MCTHVVAVNLCSLVCMHVYSRSGRKSFRLYACLVTRPVSSTIIKYSCFSLYLYQFIFSHSHSFLTRLVSSTNNLLSFSLILSDTCIINHHLLSFSLIHPTHILSCHQTNITFLSKTNFLFSPSQDQKSYKH